MNGFKVQIGFKSGSMMPQGSRVHAPICRREPVNPETEPDLFQPTSLDVAGSDLAETVAAIEARGGIVQRMDCVSVSGYRLTIAWPTPERCACEICESNQSAITQ